MKKSQKQKLPKRIVSKAEYAKVQARRTLHGMMATAAIVTGLFCSAMAALAAIILLLSSPPPEIFQGFLCCTALGYMPLKVGFVTKRKLESEDVDVVPLTRANIADLPAIESLVRASDDPQSQETVLLRAVEVGHDVNEEQLLRATIGDQ